MSKKIDNKNVIFVDLSIKLVKEGFKYLRLNDLGEVSGNCSECGHPIRYEHIYSSKLTGDEYTFGSECSYKLYVLKHWEDQISIIDIEDKQLQRAGKWLWILYRDELIGNMKEDELIPQPKDYKEEDYHSEDDPYAVYNKPDYKRLADDMKTLVMRIRRRIKKETKEKERIEKLRSRKNERLRIIKDFFVNEGIDLSVCSEKDKDFLKTVYKCHIKDWKLSDKQKKWYDDIKRRSSEKNNIEDTENYNSHTKNYVPYSDHYRILSELNKVMDVTNSNDWERNFVISVMGQINKGYSVSDKQLNIINKLCVRLSVSVKPSVKKTVKERPISRMEIIGDIIELNKKKEKKDNIIFDSEGIDFDLTRKYEDKKTKTWIIHEKFNLWTKGIIKQVKQETDKAILCNIILEDLDTIKNNVWIPIKQLEEIIIL